MTVPQGPAPAASRRWLRAAAWAILLAALLGIGALALHQRWGHGGRGEELRRAGALPALGQVPAFALLDRDGRTLRQRDLTGAPWIADFIFTRCVSSCPVLSTRMARLDRDLPPALGIRLVSFSVDPTYDSAAVLQRYALSFSASGRWHFLTGEPRQIVELSRHGFKLALEAGAGGTTAGATTTTAAVGTEPILHSTLFALVDARGTIRGYYQALDPLALQQLAADARALAAASP